jgi:hypothetical protein
MSTQAVSFHAVPARPCAINLSDLDAWLLEQMLARPPLGLVVQYEVRNVTGYAERRLFQACPSCSLHHKGDGWTRVSVPARDERCLVQHLEACFEYAWRRLDA